MMMGFRESFKTKLKIFSTPPKRRKESLRIPQPHASSSTATTNFVAGIASQCAVILLGED